MIKTDAPPELSTLCTGCSACANICPRDAISMNWSPSGFLTPAVNLEACVHCGLCTKTCPVLNPPARPPQAFDEPRAYAAWALDEAVRLNSSSGGVFTILARHILAQGGVVYGVAWNTDGELSVRHVRLDSLPELKLLNGSKYLQADPGHAYRDIKKDLKEGKTVLFSGTPCQAAALRAYLKKPWDSLFIIDIACHGVPSKNLFDAYRQDYERSTGRQISCINFRDKTHGWNHYSVMKFHRDGSGSGARIYTEDLFMQAYLSDICLGEACYNCPHASGPRTSDLTLADFWGAGYFHPKWDDSRGISLVLANTSRGEELLNQCGKELFLHRENWQAVKHTNRGIRRQPAFPSRLARRNFLRDLRQKPFTEAVAQHTARFKPRAEVGLLGVWMTCNYGAVLTSFALYRLLEQMGKSVSLIDFSFTERQKDPATVFRKFLVRERISTTPLHSLDYAYHLNDQFDTFMVGSDQVWNQGFMGHFFFLDFARGEKRKIAYGPSMGQLTEPSGKYLKKTAMLLKRFDAVSVREKPMVEHLKRHYGRESAWVMDPVFLLGRERWEELARQAPPAAKGRIVSYILDPAAEKRKLLLDASSKLGLPLLNMVDIQKKEVDNLGRLNLPNTMKEATLYEWLGNILHCEFFITDSFHGVCFALIFNKPFLCINNPMRGSGRFHSLLNLLRLQDRMLPEDAEALPENVPLTMDYAPVNELLEQKISQSREWLQQAFSGERDATLAEYSRLTEKKLTRRPPSRWGRLRKKGRKLLARAYHRIRRS